MNDQDQNNQQQRQHLDAVKGSASTASPPPESFNTAPDPVYVPPEKKRGKKGKIAAAILLALIMILTLTAGAVYAVAYDKVKLDNGELQQNISFFVQNISFMPKTPKFVLAKSFIALEPVNKHSFDVSAAIASGNFVALGLGEVDLGAKGKIDYSDTKNVSLDMSGYITSDFDFGLKKDKSNIYIKINKVPALILNIVGLETSAADTLFKDWILFKEGELTSESEQYLGADIAEDKVEINKQEIQNRLTNLYIEQILSNFDLAEDEIDGFKTYKLHFAPDPEDIDLISEELSKATNDAVGKGKASDFIKNMVADVWIDKDSYFLRKATVSFNYVSKTDGGVSASIPIGNGVNAQVAIALLLSDFNEPFTVSAPESFISIEDFNQRLRDLVSSTFLGSVYNYNLGADNFEIPSGLQI